jgi:hypothetical protein
MGVVDGIDDLVRRTQYFEQLEIPQVDKVAWQAPIVVGKYSNIFGVMAFPMPKPVSRYAGEWSVLSARESTSQGSTIPLALTLLATQRQGT